jgi:hypothetical protein
LWTVPALPLCSQTIEGQGDEQIISPCYLWQDKTVRGSRRRAINMGEGAATVARRHEKEGRLTRFTKRLTMIAFWTFIYPKKRHGSFRLGSPAPAAARPASS